MADITTTLKKKGTSDNVYPNVKLANIPYTSSLSSRDTTKLIAQSAVYDALTSTVQVDTGITTDPSTGTTFTWDISQATFESIANVILTLEVSGVDITLNFFKRHCFVARYSDHEETTLSLLDGNGDAWLLLVEYPGGTATLKHLH